MAPRDGAAVSAARVTSQLEQGGNLRFYLGLLSTDPGRIARGLAETAAESIRFLLRPRFPTSYGVVGRLRLLFKFVRAELFIPGGTTLIETIWLTYGACTASADAEDWVEVGCFKGLSTARLSLVAERTNKRLLVFDTFAGLPRSAAPYRAVDGGREYHFTAGSYAGSVDEVIRNVERYGHRTRVDLVAGDVAETLPARRPEAIQFGFLDVDLTESYKACLEGLAPAIRPGTLVMIHEACYAPIRALIEDASFWDAAGVARPSIDYIAERFALRSCRNLAFLRW